MATDNNPVPKASSTRSSSRNPRLLVPGIILLLVIVLLIAIPYAISCGAKQWILENGGDLVQVRDVDFNPFTATLVLKDMQVQVDGETKLDIHSAGVRLAWMPLIEHRIRIRNLTLDNFGISVERHESGMIRIGGIVPPESEAEVDEIKSEVPWGIGIDQIMLVNCEIRYRDPQFQTTATINTLTLSELADWTPDKAAALYLDGLLDDAIVRFEGKISPFAVQPGGSGTLNLSGLQVEKFAYLLKPTLTRLAGVLAVDLQIKGQRDQNNIINISQKGVISVAALDVATEAETVSNQKLEWNGSISTAVGTQPARVQLQTEGALTLDELVVAFPKRNGLLVRDNAMSWKGKTRFDNSNDTIDFAASGDLEVHELHATAEERNINLIDLKTLTANTFVMDALDQISVAQIDVKELTLARESAPDGDTTGGGSLNHIPDLNITNIQYSGGAGLGIDAITQTNVKAIISRDADGQWNAVRLIDVLAKLGGEEFETGAGVDVGFNPVEDDQMQAEVASGDVPGLRIGHLLTTGESRLIFRDQNTTPPFQTVLNFANLEATDIDSQKPGNPSPIKIEGSIGKHTAFNLSGTIKPFAMPVAYDFNGAIEALELPPLSSYTASQMGFELDSGQLDAEFEVKAEKGELEGKTDLAIHQLEIGAVDDKKSAEMESSLSVSLDVGLSMLRDDNNDIHLEVPFTGTPGNPEFDVGDAINQALVSAIKQGSMTYLTMALQPYGALITMAKFAGTQATKVRLNPVEFAPGSSELDSSDFEYLAKVASILEERPKLTIKICGAAVQTDRAALAQQATQSSASVKDANSLSESAQLPDTQLTALAERRDDAVKDYLVAKHGVSAKKLVACEVNIDLKEAEARPRTDLLI